MAGQTYQVNYIVNVDAANAQSAINSFKRAVSSLDKATRPITDLQNKVRGLVETMGALNRGKYSVRIDTKPATQKIGKLIRALQMAKAEVQQLNAMGITLGGTGTKGNGASNAVAAPTAVSPAKRTRTASSRMTGVSATQAKRYDTFLTKHPTNLGYKLWGPTPLPNNGGMAIDMLKGMGIAYGLSGAGMLISEVFNEATEYDNIMKTVENILKSHDDEENFAGRFAHMTQVIRNVGMKTKFTMAEVADAARFLAMAGLNVNAIKQSISPIADIALVGDTELGETADVVTNIMTAYNIAPNKMRNAADIMTNTFTMSNTTLLEIAEAYKYAASLLSAGGISFEEATAAIGVLGDAGIKSSQAGTTMRTIMANIANPTKKQQAGWDAIGVSLTDKSGKRKDLLQIFQELHEKDLDVDAFYRIFHKTAASGAVALAAHADKWEAIYLENFLADGMTRRLAEEKQNTFQGLWAQLTSVFTDQGVTAFNGVQGELRALMKTAIDWMDPNKNPDAQKAFREVANALMEFIHIMIDASKWFIWFFDKFGSIIKMWAKFQLMIWPVVKAVTALKSVFLGLLGLRKVSSMVLGLSSAFGNLNKSLLRFGRNWAHGSLVRRAIGKTAVFLGHTTPFGVTGASVQNGTVGGAMFGGIAPLSHRQYMKAAKGLDLSMPHASTKGMLMPYIGVSSVDLEADKINSKILRERQAEDRAALNRYRQNRKTFNRRVLGWQTLNGLAGLGKMGLGAAGMVIGMHQMTKENANGWDVTSGALSSAAGMAAMVGGPAGWIAAAGLALGSLGASLASFNKNLNDLSVFVDDFTKSHQLLDGVLLNGKTRTERYLEFVWRKNYDINDLIQRRTELMKELLGIETPNATTAKDIGNEEYKSKYKKFAGSDSLFGSPGAAQNAADMFNKYGKQFGLSVDRHTEISGETIKDGMPITETYWAFRDDDGNIMKFSNPDGTSDANDVVMYDVAAAMEMLHGPYRSKIIDENQRRLAAFLYGKSTADDVKAWRDTFSSTYGPSSWGDKVRPDEWNTPAEVAEHWTGEDVVKSYIGSQLLWKSLFPITNAQNAIIDFKEKLKNGALEESDIVNAIRWGDYKILGNTLKEYDPNDIAGWYRNLGYAGNGVWRDPAGRETPEVMAQTAEGHMRYFLDAIKELNLENHPKTQLMQEHAKTLIAHAQAFLGDKPRLNLRDGAGDDGNGYGANSLDYKPTGKGHAVPKQININIQNLMKVDSIDLTNADNVAIIDRMKREVAYALYEAAADGTMMLNGLANT